MPKSRKILVIDDELEMLENCARILKKLGHECLTCNESENALQLIRTETPALVITDLKMAGIDGLTIVRESRIFAPELPVIVMTGFASVESAVEAMKAGAFDYLSKPFSLDQFSITLNRALEQLKLREENKNLKAQLRETYQFSSIIGNSPAIQAVFEIIRKVAKSDANILILGESGTGKELVARSIHTNSSRVGSAFMAVDCVSLPDQLLESELFGHEKGAFTGATGTKPGLLELAHGGSLFLDEIGELGISIQAKLLRVLQERQFRRVGGTRLIDVDMRLITGTNRDLERMVAEGGFRQDLYYRLNVICIKLPPLRERIGDVSLLAHYFCQKYSAKQQKNLEIAEEAMVALEEWSWPGNVRELKNIIERAVTLAEGKQITLKELPHHLTARTVDQQTTVKSFMPFAAAKKEWISAFEKEYLTNLLERYNWNISHSAVQAGIDRKTIQRLLRKYQITRDI